jgi:hypothetical protein
MANSFQEWIPCFAGGTINTRGLRKVVNPNRRNLMINFEKWVWVNKKRGSLSEILKALNETIPLHFTLRVL